MRAKPRILCLGSDPALNGTRRLLLERLFDVRVAASVSEAGALLRDEPVQVLLVCHSTPLQDARAVVRLVGSRWPETRIVALEQGEPRLFLRGPHLEFQPEGPADLLKKLTTVTGLS